MYVCMYIYIYIYIHINYIYAYNVIILLLLMIIIIMIIIITNDTENVKPNKHNNKHTITKFKKQQATCAALRSSRTRGRRGREL